jgi:hypothetical protein
MNDFLKNNCDGAGPHGGLSEVRAYPLGGGANLILCAACFRLENRYRLERAREFGEPDQWPQVDFATAAVYATESEGVQS